MWESRRSVRLGGSSVAIPCRSDMLIHLMCHAAFHGGSRLLWLWDIHRLATRCMEEPDWDRVVRRRYDHQTGET